MLNAKLLKKLQKVYNEKIDLYKKGLNKFIIKHVDFNKKILDVGCCEGRLGRYLKKHKKSTVFGIDISGKAIDKAKKNLDGAYIVDIEEDNLPFSSKSFDVIICADILEHLRDPLFVLKKLKPYLKNDGVFIISVPNIANINIRWDLLRGKFDYEKEGIMDDSHLRFFTKKTLRQLISRAGMRIVAIDYSPGFPFFFFQGRVLKFRIIKSVHQILTKLAPTLFCRQFIIVARL